MRKLYTPLGIIVFLWLTGCSIPEIKQPKFTIEVPLLIEQIKEMNQFENVQIQSTVSAHNDQTSYYIVVHIKNGQHLPEDDKELSNLGLQIAEKVKNKVENAEEFDAFSIVFHSDYNVGFVRAGNSRQYNFRNTDI
ncbi:hypothetical protein GXP67_35700 [Rhodocytophaga rosea]|uniref:Lipoprotein n=1 Tax=Rhodocytophaga rosea TaxID=2704465 RepID=A0A6C0GTX6_9BACT|nr:hypothetical protein [Rhodocytophaga rosea]QHT71638.1 hypothetical protein GXP67_35700 [Rhodocytophaga rosea]